MLFCSDSQDLIKTYIVHFDAENSNIGGTNGLFGTQTITLQVLSLARPQLQSAKFL